MPWIEWPPREPNQGRWGAWILGGLLIGHIAADALGQKQIASWLANGFVVVIVCIIGLFMGAPDPER